MAAVQNALAPNSVRVDDTPQPTGIVPSFWYVHYEFCRQVSIAFRVSFGPRRRYSQRTLAKDENKQARSAVPSR